MATRISRTAHDLRKTPRQRRSTATVDTILEAAARILETQGLDGFNTNAVATRAGISVGSLYQYFPSKHAVLAELVRRHRSRTWGRVGAAIEKSRGKPLTFLVRALVEVAVDQQFERPALARTLDYVEADPTFGDQGADDLKQALEQIARALRAHGIRDPKNAAEDLIVLARSLTDAAGQRLETNKTAVATRIANAALGYLAQR